MNGLEMEAIRRAQKVLRYDPGLDGASGRIVRNAAMSGHLEVVLNQHECRVGHAQPYAVSARQQGISGNVHMVSSIKIDGGTGIISNQVKGREQPYAVATKVEFEGQPIGRGCLMA